MTLGLSARATTAGPRSKLLPARPAAADRRTQALFFLEMILMSLSSVVVFV
jgi:hypothetical protein